MQNPQIQRRRPLREFDCITGERSNDPAKRPAIEVIKSLAVIAIAIGALAGAGCATYQNRTAIAAGAAATAAPIVSAAQAAYAAAAGAAK